LSAAIKLPLDSDLTVGYEYSHEEGENTSVLDLPFIGPTPADFALSRHTNSGFAELIMRPMRTLIVQLDVRYDDVSGLGAETSPGVGVRYDFVATGTTLKGRWAEGFRAPSFFALADPLVGNPNLVAETSQGGEIGLEQSLLKDMARFDLTLFRTRYKNLVDYDPTIGFFGQLVNRSNVDTQGVEAMLDVRPTRAFGVKFGYTYLDADIVGSDQPLRNRPANRAFFALNYEFAERWLFSWNTAYVGEVDNFSVPTGDVQLDSYLLTDVALSYKWRQVTATFAIDNLFDERYQQFPGFENPGIRARASIAGKF
jgi:outer membrane receptor protein involved in Fe transport